MDDYPTARIPLRNRQREVVAYALVDAADEAMVLAAGPWYLNSRYVRHGWYDNGKMRHVLLHRFILQLAKGDPRTVDHINRDRLDNRRVNLRIVTHGLNMHNQGARSNAASPYRGVSRSGNKWSVEVRINKVRHYLGTFDDELEAARVARDFRLANMPGALD